MKTHGKSKQKIHLLPGSLRVCPNLCLVNQINLWEMLEVAVGIVDFYMQCLGTLKLAFIQIGTTET